VKSCMGNGMWALNLTTDELTTLIVIVKEAIRSEDSNKQSYLKSMEGYVMDDDMKEQHKKSIASMNARLSEYQSLYDRLTL